MSSKKLMLQKMMYGHFIEHIPEDCSKKIIYVLQGDGLWKRFQNKIFTYDERVEDFKVPGLKEDMEEGWELNVPKIPADILVQITSFFKKINRLYDSEVFVQVYYNQETEEYFAEVPEQTVSGASVNYTNDNVSAAQDPNNILVFEIHSHNTMNAFFSGIDNADEKDDRFYGVIGRVGDYFPQILVRLSVNGMKIDVAVEDIFDIENSDINVEAFPPEWLNQVKKQHFLVRKYRGSRTVYHPIHSAFPSRQLSVFDSDEDDIEDKWNQMVFGDKPPQDERSADDWESILNMEADDDDDNQEFDPRKMRF